MRRWFTSSRSAILSGVKTALRFSTPGTQALIGLSLLSYGVARQFGTWYACIVAGVLLVALAVLAEVKT